MICEFCGAEAYSESIRPVMCRRHYEVALLVSRLERRGEQATATAVQDLLRRAQVPFLIEVEEVPGLLADLQREE